MLKLILQIIFAFTLLTIGSLLLGVFVETNGVIKLFDDKIYEAIVFGPHTGFLNLLVWPINNNFLPLGPMPSFFYPWIVALLGFILIFKRSEISYLIFILFLSTFAALIIAFVDWHFVYRQRPYLFLPNEVNSSWQHIWNKFSSYPSGHSRDSAMYAYITQYFLPKLKWLMAIFVIFVGWSRLYVGAHYPSDVFSGILIGILTGIIAIKATEKIKGKLSVLKK